MVVVRVAVVALHGCGGVFMVMAVVIVVGMLVGPVAALFRRRMAVLVAVVPKLGLVEQEEKHQAQQQGQKQGLGVDATLKSLGQQVDKSGGEQGTCRQAEQMLRAKAAAFAANAAAHQGGSNPHAAQTGCQSGQHDCDQSHLGVSVTPGRAPRW